MGQYVYLFRDGKRRPVYVGRGERISRAESHLSGTHNAGLESLIGSGKFSVEAAGPYGDELTARAVEAALISALDGSPGFANVAPGDGPRFAPLGVPAHLAARLDEPRLSLEQLGRLVGQRLGGGVLLVRLSSGGAFTSHATRAKYDPAAPDDAVIFENTIRWWWLRELVAGWQAQPDQTPAVVAGLAGPPSRRYVAGSVLVDRGASWDQSHDPDYQVPTALRSSSTVDVDACELRGRIVDGALFSQIKPGHFLWVDAAGGVRYAPPRPLAPVCGGSAPGRCHVTAVTVSASPGFGCTIDDSKFCISQNPGGHLIAEHESAQFEGYLDGL
jgi:hypothetical protein